MPPSTRAQGDSRGPRDEQVPPAGVKALAAALGLDFASAVETVKANHAKLRTCPLHRFEGERKLGARLVCANCGGEVGVREASWYERGIEHERFRLSAARTRDTWMESDGVVLWWRFPVVEPPYVGSPLDEDFPEYVTHWTVIVVPIEHGLVGQTDVEHVRASR